MQNPSNLKTVVRYHPLVVALHWLMALLLISGLGAGFFVLAATPNTAPEKIDALRVHMAIGVLILALMIIRLGARMLTSKPARLSSENPLADRIASLMCQRQSKTDTVVFGIGN